MRSRAFGKACRGIAATVASKASPTECGFPTRNDVECGFVTRPIPERVVRQVETTFPTRPSICYYV